MLYNSKGIECNFDDYVYFNQGTCAKIFRKDDTLLKIYKYDCKYRNIISKNMFETLKTIDNDCIVKLDDYYHYYDELKIFGFIDAYTMYNVKNDYIKLLDSPLEYLKSCLDGFEKLSKELSKERVVMFDTNPYNIVFNNEKGVIIDPDKFYFNNFRTYKNTLIKNRIAILEYIKSYMLKEIDCYDFSNLLRIIRLFNDYKDYNDELPIILDNIFMGKNPKELIKKN